MLPHLDHSALFSAVVRGIEIIEQNATPLVMEIERRSPGHRFGLAKHEHMRKLANEAHLIAVEYELSVEEGYLFVIICRAHDLGRHLQVGKILTPTQSSMHGTDSAHLLKSWGALQSFTEGQQEIIETALVNHSLRHDPVDDGSEAVKLSMVLRELDRTDLLLRRDFLEPAGIWTQIKLWYATQFSSGALDDAKFKAGAVAFIEGVLEGHASVATGVEFGADFEVLKEIVTGPIHEKALKSFLLGETVDDMLIINSYSTYLLRNLGSAQRIKNRPAVRRLQMDGCISRYVGTLIKLCPNSERNITGIASTLRHLDPNQPLSFPISD